MKKEPDYKVQLPVGTIRIAELRKRQYIRRFIDWISRQESEWHRAESRMHTIPDEARGELADTMISLDESMIHTVPDNASGELADTMRAIEETK